MREQVAMQIPKRASRSIPSQDIEDDDAVYPTRPPSSAIRYTRPRQEIYTDGNRRIVVHHEPPPKKRSHWMLYLGIVFFVMIFGWIAITALGVWWQGKQDDWKYGNPRTSQADQFVGHGDSSDHPDHFIAVNTGGMIEVIEMNVISPKNDHIYPITSTTNPYTPVTISFQDVNHDGKIDMLVTIGDTNSYTVVLL